MTKKVKKYLSGLLSLAFVFTLLPSPGNAAELINESFDNGAVAPPGWVLNVTGTYTTDASSGNAIPSLKFGATGDYIETETFANANAVSFWTKGYSISATSSLSVEGFDGLSWVTISEISNLANTENITEIGLESNIVKLRFTYDKDVGNLAFDDLVVSGDNTQATPPADNSLNATVSLTINETSVLVGQNQADIAFSVNGDSLVNILYGETSSYGNESGEANVNADTEATVSLNNLSCSTTYHYQIQAENLNDASDVDLTDDKTFTTETCGIVIDNLAMTKATAKAKDSYDDAFKWQFDLSVLDVNETALQMKFSQWQNESDNSLVMDSGANMRISVDNGLTWTDITANDTYSAAVDISAIDLDDTADGRQVSVLVEMKIPTGTRIGAYSANYGINIQ